MWDLLLAASAIACALWVATLAFLVAERIHQHRKAQP